MMQCGLMKHGSQVLQWITTVKLGRQSLDTPLVFTETWGVDTNTFEAAVLLNQSLPDTTIVAAWIGKSSGSANDTAGVLNTLGAASAGYVSEEGKFNTFHDKGAYTAGIVNNSFKPLNLQAWYYEVPSVADAIWVQADLDMDGILAGAQYTTVSLKASGTEEDSAAGVMLGYAMKDTATIKVAYSAVDQDGSLGNVGNLDTTTKQSKLYTEMWWNYGQVSRVGTDTLALSVEANLAGIDLLAGYYAAEQDTDANTDSDVTEIALVASKSYGPLDTSVALIQDDYDYELAAVEDHTDLSVLVMLGYNF